MAKHKVHTHFSPKDMCTLNKVHVYFYKVHVYLQCGCLLLLRIFASCSLWHRRLQGFKPGEEMICFVSRLFFSMDACNFSDKPSISMLPLACIRNLKRGKRNCSLFNYLILMSNTWYHQTHMCHYIPPTNVLPLAICQYVLPAIPLCPRMTIMSSPPIPLCHLVTKVSSLTLNLDRCNYFFFYFSEHWPMLRSKTLIFCLRIECDNQCM